MNTLADLQRAMQRAVMGKPGAADGLVAKPPAGSQADRLAVYRNAYGLRLTEFIAHDYDKLRIYLGDVRFNEMASRYILAHPSDQPNARWFSRHLPDFLAASPHYRRQPEIEIQPQRDVLQAFVVADQAAGTAQLRIQVE